MGFGGLTIPVIPRQQANMTYFLVVWRDDIRTPCVSIG
jgi:hypothetical protein